MGTYHVGTDKIDALKVSAAQIGSKESCVGHVGAGEVRVRQVRSVRSDLIRRAPMSLALDICALIKMDSVRSDLLRSAPMIAAPVRSARISLASLNETRSTMQTANEFHSNWSS